VTCDWRINCREIFVSAPEPREHKAGSTLARGALVLLLLAFAGAAARQGVAAWLGRRTTLNAVTQARVLDPSNPNIPVAASEILSDLPDVNPGLAVEALESATRAGPDRALNWALLAEAYDFAGNPVLADKAFRRGLALFPRSPKINWMYANFLIRADHATRSLGPLTFAIDGDRALRAGAFDLAWRGGLSPEQILAAVPARADALSAYLDYLARTNRLDAAADVWSRLGSIAAPPDLGASLHYFDSLLYAHQVDAMVSVWSALARRYPSQIRAQASANLITNGSFEAMPLNGGLDWRIVPVSGAEVSLDSAGAHDGSRSLRVIFDGAHNLEFTHVVQYVPVEPNITYRFSAYARAESITTDSGPRFAIYDPFDKTELSVATANMTGTFNWQPQSLDFTTGPNTHLIVVQLLRPAGRKFDNQIAGTLWLDSISLTAQSIE
jgi:Carbohydrate binding domain